MWGEMGCGGRWDLGGDGMRGVMGCRSVLSPAPETILRRCFPSLKKGGCLPGRGVTPPQETGRGSWAAVVARWAEIRRDLRRSGGCLSSAGGVFGCRGELPHQGWGCQRGRGVLGSLSRGDRASVPAPTPLPGSLSSPAGACVISFALRNPGFLCGDIT